MYTLLSGLWKEWTQKDDFYVLILGLDNAGKSTFLESAKAKFTKDYKGQNPNKITCLVAVWEDKSFLKKMLAFLILLMKSV